MCCARAAWVDCALCCAGGFTSLRMCDGLCVVAVAVLLHCAGAGRPAGGVYFLRCAGAPEAVPLAAASPSELFTKSFSSLLGLKNGIFFGGTSTFAPVFGFLPIRPRRCRVRKLPNPRISILSPFCRASMMLSKIVSTMVSDSFRGSSEMRSTSSIRSAFVNVGCLVINPYASLPRAEPAAEAS